jgi:hypothetical protein
MLIPVNLPINKGLNQLSAIPMLSLENIENSGTAMPALGLIPIFCHLPPDAVFNKKL